LVHWIVPRDVYVINRSWHESPDSYQQLLEALAEEWSTEKQGLEALERHAIFLRIFAEHEPSSFRSAVLSQTEVAELRKVQNVVRLGHVLKVGFDTITLQHGSIPMPAGALCIDCTASANCQKDVQPVFSEKRITLQLCWPVLYDNGGIYAPLAATIAFVEAQLIKEDDKNNLCPAICNAASDAGWFLVSPFFQDRQRQRWEKLGIYEAWSKRMAERSWLNFTEHEVDPAVKASAVAQSKQLLKSKFQQPR